MHHAVVSYKHNSQFKTEQQYWLFRILIGFLISTVFAIRNNAKREITFDLGGIQVKLEKKVYKNYLCLVPTLLSHNAVA